MNGNWGTGTAHANIVPYQAFRTSDGGFYIIGCVTDAHFAHLCRLLSARHSPPDWLALAASPRFATNAARVRPNSRAALLSLIARAFARQPLHYWNAFFEGAPFPCGPVLDVGQAFELEQVRFAHMALELRHPSGRLMVPGPAVRYTPPSAGAGAVEGAGDDAGKRLEANPWPHPVSPPPQLGEHTDEVLREELGLERSLLERLHQQGVLYTL